jgi:DNA-3-methyladenine glycosylase
MLSQEFYSQDDVVAIARQLLGKFLCTYIDGELTSGVIIETEAYRGPEDRASHAFGNRRTKRTEVMFQQGGICYIYMCYGLHVLLNVVTNVQGIPHAVLIRSIAPTEGIPLMLQRRRQPRVSSRLASGPGCVAEALGLTLAHNGLSLQGPTIWIEDRGMVIAEEEITATPRIGIAYAGSDVLLPWRFTWQHKA